MGTCSWNRCIRTASSRQCSRANVTCLRIGCGYLMGGGTHLRKHEKIGAHAMKLEGVTGVNFAVWAPNARRVSVVGDFNHWDGRCHAMRNHPGNGIWAIFIPGLGEGALYKFEVKARSGEEIALKADPYACAF